MFTHQYIAILQMKAKMGNITLTTILLKKIAFSKVVIVLKSQIPDGPSIQKIYENAETREID